ncbi:MAG: 30S ribosomal protein S7 [Candidatus Hodgkinia cicadicola]|nr:MAG: 30S ribosomal protein S7 [Candidatus Hodgkinia cicadicola]
MSRGYKRKRLRPLARDVGSIVLAKLTNYLMVDGKKCVASKLLSNSLNCIRRALAINPIKVLYEALDNITPFSEVRSKKVGGVSYQVPIDVPSERRLSLALKWLVASARRRKEANMWARLAQEIIDSALAHSLTCRKSRTLRELVFANQAFAHLGW